MVCGSALHVALYEIAADWARSELLGLAHGTGLVGAAEASWLPTERPFVSGATPDSSCSAPSPRAGCDEFRDQSLKRSKCRAQVLCTLLT